MGFCGRATGGLGAPLVGVGELGLRREVGYVSVFWEQRVNAMLRSKGGLRGEGGFGIRT